MDSDLEAALERVGIRKIYDDWTSPPEAILKRLLDNLKADKRTAEWTVDLVHDLGPVTEDVIPALVSALDYEERCARPIRRALVAFGPAAMAQLVHEFRGKKANVEESLRCALLIQAIGEFGAAAAETVPDLVECLDDSMLHVRVHAAIALWRIDGRAKGRAGVVVQGIWLPGLWEIVDPACLALCEMGTEAQEVLPVLIGVLAMTDERHLERYRLGISGAISVLESMGSAAAAAIPALEAAQSVPDKWISGSAAKALESIRRQVELPAEQSSDKPTPEVDDETEAT